MAWQALESWIEQILEDALKIMIDHLQIMTKLDVESVGQPAIHGPLLKPDKVDLKKWKTVCSKTGIISSMVQLKGDFLSCDYKLRESKH